MHAVDEAALEMKVLRKGEEFVYLLMLDMMLQVSFEESSLGSMESHSRFNAAPPPTATVIENAKPVNPNSRFRTLARERNIASLDCLLRPFASAKADENNAGPRESDNARGYVRSATWAG